MSVMVVSGQVMHDHWRPDQTADMTKRDIEGKVGTTGSCRAVLAFEPLGQDAHCGEPAQLPKHHQ